LLMKMSHLLQQKLLDKVSKKWTDCHYYIAMLNRNKKSTDPM